MKKLFLVLLVAAYNSFAQELPTNADGKITFEEVIEVPNKNALDLYKKSLEWFAIKYNSANDVIQLKDEDLKKIIGKGTQSIPYYMRSPKISHLITVEAKENKVRITLTDLAYEDSSDSFQLENFPKGWFGKKKLFNTVKDKTLFIIADYKKYMLNDANSKW
ncbi:DUF4468 domain-containing protein [Flavobacterium sp.]|uniref:DUF4468 domain-containing protein n=1 Tax=Flavobacterium sp. TaxID=239 RepID=UPI00262A3AA7|nr:DUF4468 domain-containing protein [Flavobacterium sp.]